ncbi:hypothetical protein H7X69_00095 [Candidatus Saccharibacteria bacterium]|nr:hypothetical protein [Candidatus Saccharibacteria bacterium]
MTIARIETQPNFPQGDITDHNAAMIEILLQDSSFVERAHECSETHVLLYKLVHHALKQYGIANNFPLANHLAFSHGAAAYETMATLVRPIAPRYDHFQTAGQAASIADLLHDGANATMLFVDARDRFVSEQPLAAETIKLASKLYDIALPEDYILLGAAIERQLEMDVLDGVGYNV